MRMWRNKYIIFGLFLLICGQVSAQKQERDYIRKGNRQYKDSLFVDAEINYRKALEINPASAQAYTNLGNALAYQDNFQEAMEQYMSAAKIEKDKDKLAAIFHNAGVLLHAAQEYEKAIECYKQSLRNNPKDDETRYNLALAQKMLQDQQDQQDQQQDQDQQNDQQDQQQDQDQNNDNDNQDQQNQDQQPPEPEQNENEMSKENAEQLLNSVLQDERDVQDKVKKQQVIQGGRLEKDW
ncbi:MAG: tetratricopeptide repeat protein [Bacteroides sp.]|nr:tetratricopeptide repeat protein [Bacteroides sp.]